MTTRSEYIEHNIETPTNGRVLVRPPRGRGAGVLAGFHGYAESADVQMERLAGIRAVDDWVLVSVQALNRFYRSRSEETVAGWMTRQDRERAIEANVVYVDRTLAWIRREYGGEVPLLLVGFSQGAAMAFRAGVRGQWRADGIIAVGADVPPELLANSGTRFPPVLLVRGERDDWYTQEKFVADISALHTRLVAVTAFLFDGSHEWTPDVAEQAAAFIRTVASQFNPHG